MEFRRLGRSELPVSRVVFGAMWHGLRGDEPARTRVLHEAIDLGITSIDTAPLYDFGGSEEHLGRVLGRRRADVSLLTKVGLRWDSDHGEVLFEATIGGRRRAVRRDARPEAVRRDVEASLTRLKTDRLDLVQVHHLDARTPVEDTLGELARLRAAGKIREIGVCNHPAAALRRAAAALGDRGLASSQEHYSLVTRHVEAEVLPTLRELGAGLLAYSPLEQGILAGRLLGSEAGLSSRGPLFHPANARRINAALRATAVPIAAQHDASLSQIALAWLLHQPGLSAVICGASTREQLASNASAVQVELSAGELQSLSSVFAALPLARHRGESPMEWARRFWRRRMAGLRRRLGGSAV